MAESSARTKCKAAVQAFFDEHLKARSGGKAETPSQPQ